MSVLRRLRQFAAAEKSGLAALEFAIIAPMMILLVFGSVDLIDTLGANKRAQNAASSIADVVARDDAVSDAEVTGLWAALDVLMYPDPGAVMEMRVSSIRIESSTSARVVWSEGHGMTARVANTTVTLPSQMMTAGTSVIMTESSYPYTAPLGFLHAGSVDLEHTSIRRSRLIDPIPRVS